MGFIDPNISSGPCSLMLHELFQKKKKDKNSNFYTFTWGNIWRVVFVFLQFSSGCLALCQKFYSEKFKKVSLVSVLFPLCFIIIH